MRAVIQRVREAQVSVEGNIVGQIQHGLVVLLGVTTGDTEAEADLLSKKIIGLRVFSDRTRKICPLSPGREWSTVDCVAIHAVRRYAQRPPPIVYSCGRNGQRQTVV